MRSYLSISVVFLFLSFTCFAQAAKLKSDVTYSLDYLFNSGQKNKMVKDKATLTFDLKSSTAKCFLSCNYIDLKYTIKKNKYKSRSVIPGSIPCPDRLIGVETDLKDNFAKIDSYIVLDKKICFFNKKDTLLVFYEQ